MRKQSFIDNLSENDRNDLINRLLKRQDNKSYISGEIIDLRYDKVEIDHIISMDKEGIDDESNCGVVKDRENSSKGNRDLQLLRFIYNFRKHRDNYLDTKKDFTFGDALQEFYPKRSTCKVFIDKSEVKLVFTDLQNNIKEQYFNIVNDEKNKVQSIVGMIPFEILHHDISINPRSIVDLEPLIAEFYGNNPQLFPSLATLTLDSNNEGKIMVFDGQHKGASQLYLRNKNLFLRVFLNINKNNIMKTNLRAHTIVAQIHFPHLITDKVGHDLFKIEYEHFIEIVDLENNSEHTFTKKEGLNDEYKNYLKNYYKYKILIDEDGDKHRIIDYVETISSRSKKLPISYDTLEKTFLRLLYLKPSSHQLKRTINFRKLEIINLRKIMNLYVEEILDNKFKMDIGIFKLEEKLKEDPDSIPNDHLIAYRMCRQSAMVIWIEEFRKALVQYLKTTRSYEDNNFSKEMSLWVNLKDEDYKVIKNMFKIIRMNSIWAEKLNEEILNSFSSTRQSDWKEILINGKLPGRNERLFTPLTDAEILKQAINI